jgi:hypothetical protein
MDMMHEFVERALTTWRSKRDTALADHGLNLNEVYAKGDFESLPPECLMAVCYVDAYASVNAQLEQGTVSTKEIINLLTKRDEAVVSFVDADAGYCVKNEKANEGVEYEYPGPAVLVIIKGEFRDGN